MAKTAIELPYNWQPRRYQYPLWKHFHTGNDADKRAACVWPRRHGKDLLAINLIADKAMERVGTYWHLFPEFNQGRRIIWNGMTDEGRPFLDHFPERLISRRYENDMRIHFIHPTDSGKEGSVYQVVGSDNIDSLIGANPIGVVLSEYAVQDPAAWDYIRPIVRQNHGWALFISTVRGHNHWHKLFHKIKTSPRWFTELLSSRTTRRDDGTPVISEAQIAEEREDGMPEEMIAQEFYSDWEAPLVGAYYSALMERARIERRICAFAPEPRLPMITSWDIGVDDATAVVFSQEYGLEKRVVDYYENHGEGLPHYVGVLKERGYIYGQHNLPWDIEIREFSSGKARIETLRACMKEHGITGRIMVTKQHLVPDSIEQGRAVLPYCWFNEQKCARLIEAMKTYRKKWDDKLKLFSTHPVRDWSTHACAAYQTMAWNSKHKSRWEEKRRDRAIDEEQYAYL